MAASGSAPRLRAALFVVATGDEGTGAAGLALLTHRLPPAYGKEDADGADDPDAPPPTPLQQLLVNAPECGTRVLQEGRHKLTGASHVLVTAPAPGAVAGLPSLLFHVSDRGGGELTAVVPGGPGCPLPRWHADVVGGFVGRAHPAVTTTVVGGGGGGSSSGDFDGAAGGVDVSLPHAWAALRRGGAPAGVTMQAVPVYTDAAGGVDGSEEDDNGDVGGSGAAASAARPPKRARVDRAVAGVCYVLTVGGLFAAVPRAAVAAGGGSCGTVAATGSSSDDDSVASCSVRSDRGGEGGGNNADGRSSSDSSEESSASPSSADGDGGAVTRGSPAVPARRHTVVVIDAGATVGRRLVTPASLACQLAAAGVGPSSGGGGGGDTVVVHLWHEPPQPSQSGASSTGSRDFDADAYRAALMALFSERSNGAADGSGSVAHYHVGSGRTTVDVSGGLATHFPAAARQAAVLAAVEPALWPLGAVAPAAAVGDGSSPSPQPPPPLHPFWCALPPRASVCLGSGRVTLPPPLEVSADAAAAAAAADATGHARVTLSPLQQADKGATGSSHAHDANEIDIESGGDAGVGTSAASAVTSASTTAATSLAFPHVVLLGTGAAAPSKLRSCSGLLLSSRGGSGDCGDATISAASSSAAATPPPARTRLLLDAGEGALGRLGQVAGALRTPLPSFLLSIGAVAISHMHADHHTGLPALLDAYTAAAVASPAPPRHPLLVFGPHRLGACLEGYWRLTAGWRGLPPGARPPWVFCGPDPGASPAAAALLPAALPWVAGWARPRVDHGACGHAVGDVVTVATTAGPPGTAFTQFAVLAYSGDTRPCASLVDAAAAAASGAGRQQQTRPWTQHQQWRVVAEVSSPQPPPPAPVPVLLVHEATMNDDRAGDAHAKGHATVGGAAGMAAALAARLAAGGGGGSGAVLVGAVLTHFSQRYPRLVGGGSDGGTPAASPPAAGGGAASQPSILVPPTPPLLLAHDGMAVPLAPRAAAAASLGGGGVAARLAAAWGTGVGEVA